MSRNALLLYIRLYIYIYIHTYIYNIIILNIPVNIHYSHDSPQGVVDVDLTETPVKMVDRIFHKQMVFPLCECVCGY